MVPVDEPFGVTLSLFERLTNENPTVTEETPRQRSASVADLQASVMEHLQVLLNTRRGDHGLDSPYQHVVHSLMTYGVTDFNSLSLANPAERERLRRSIERAIRLFEPRLTQVDVTLEEWQPEHPGLHFRIEAMLRVDREREPVSFDARLAKDIRMIAVKVAS